MRPRNKFGVTSLEGTHMTLLTIENGELRLNSNLDEYTFGKTGHDAILSQEGALFDGKNFRQWTFEEVKSYDAEKNGSKERLVFYCVKNPLSNKAKTLSSFYEEGGDAYSGFILTIPSPGDAKTRYSFSQNPYLAGFSENETEFYNGLYSFISSYIDGEYDDLIKADGIDAAKADEGYTEQYNPDITGEAIALWGTYEPDVTYEAPDGREYGLVPVDRALGSSYYVLMSYAKKGDLDSAKLINMDPFCGSGGEANLLAFLEDGKTGFIGLTYNGGDDGLLFMTGDGGESFAEVSLPVPEITLPDGRLYNPFTVPEEVWEEPGKVYLKVGQGANGDYYNEELACHPCGIYVSENKGKTFSFLKEGKEEE